MLKYVGLLLLFSCATLAGGALAGNLTRKERRMAQILDLLRQLAVHLKTSMSPPGELVRRLSLQSTLADCPLLVELENQFRFSNSFRKNIRQAVEKTGLGGTPEGTILLALGDEIGERPLEHQLSALEASTLILERELEEMREYNRKYAPLYRRLGVLGGLLLVVVLL